jgi:hypothetical protein
MLHELVSEFPDGIDVQLAQTAKPLVRAVVEKPAFDKVFDLLDALGLQVAGFGVRDVLVDRLCNRQNLVSDDTDLAGRLPAPHLLLSGAPYGHVEGLANVLAAE